MEYYGRKRPSVFGYFLSALLGAVVGGFLLLTFGPEAIFKRLEPKEIVKEDTKKEVVVETKTTDITKARENLILRLLVLEQPKYKEDCFKTKRFKG